MKNEIPQSVHFSLAELSRILTSEAAYRLGICPNKERLVPAAHFEILTDEEGQLITVQVTFNRLLLQRKTTAMKINRRVLRFHRRERRRVRKARAEQARVISEKTITRRFAELRRATQ